MRNGHAIVLGAGIAGLVTAGVLADFYERVTVVERDPLPGPDATRRGVPQGKHGHALMPGGARELEGLFPGLLAEMTADGAVAARPLARYRMRVSGHDLRPVSVGVPAVQASRPFLEEHLRRRVLGRDGVWLTLGCDAVGLVTDGHRVTGVRIMRRTPGSAEETLPADLVVDAMGRGGRTSAWLAGLGYGRPPEEELTVDVGYASRILRLPPDGAERAGHAVGVGAVPGHARGMMLLAIENGRHILTVTGIGRPNHPPADDAGFLDFVASMAPPDVLDAVRDAEPLGAIATYRYPSYLRRRYDRMRRLPAGLLVAGDALCSFSPIYAQGMTVAAMQATALHRCLARGDRDLARRYFRAAAQLATDPWRMAVGADLTLPEVPGRRTAAVRAQCAYTARVLAAAERDDVVSAQFMRVLGLLDPPASLLRPRVLLRVVAARATPGPESTSRGNRPAPLAAG